MDVPGTPTAAEVPLKDTPTEVDDDAASDASRESWPDATALAALPGTAFSGEVHARRDNARLGWRRCSAIVTRGDGAAEACLQLKEKTALVRELQLSNLSTQSRRRPRVEDDAAQPARRAAGLPHPIEATPPPRSGPAARHRRPTPLRWRGEGDDSSRFAGADGDVRAGPAGRRRPRGTAGSQN